MDKNTFCTRFDEAIRSAADICEELLDDLQADTGDDYGFLYRYADSIEHGSGDAFIVTDLQAWGPRAIDYLAAKYDIDQIIVAAEATTTLDYILRLCDRGWKIDGPEEVRIPGFGHKVVTRAGLRLHI